MAMLGVLSGRLVGATVVVGAILLAAAPYAPAQAPALRGQTGTPTLAPLLDDVTPAVVNIAVVSRVVEDNPLLRDPFFRRFFNLPDRPVERRQMSAGSGVIVDAAKGLVLTNNHVVENGDQIQVTLKDRRQFQAKLVGTDKGTDIALLKIEATKLTALTFADSDRLRVGDYVVAIGNPFGLGQTVTLGIISALGRSGLNIEGYEDFIQTDASINPGNSGGALVTLRGELAGINTAIIGPAGGNVGIGFAVPANMARAVMDQLERHGEVRRGRLGVSIQDLTPDIASALSLEVDRGAVISAVEPGSPAAEAGIRAGDVVVELNGRAVQGSTDFRNRIGLVPVGETVALVILRDGRRQTVTAKIAATAQQAALGGAAQQRLAGATLRDIGPASPLAGKADGALVAEIAQGSPAWQAGLRQGDVIMGVNRHRVRSVQELEAALQGEGQALALNVRRGEANLLIVVR